MAVRKAPPGFIVGAGGGGEAQEPVRTPDNLLSQDYFELVLAISEGPIKGHYYEDFLLENFFADSTAAMNQATGETNFSDFSAMLYAGTEDDGSVELKLGGTSANIPVGVTLAQGVPVTRTTPAIQRNSFNQLEVRIKFDYLARTTTEGQFNSTVLFRIQYRKSSETDWKDYNGQSQVSVTGKTATGYVKDFIIPVDVANVDYDVRVTKISPDNVQGVHENVAVLSWESFQVVRLGEQQFDDVAFMHIYGKASNQFTQVPEFSGVFDGIVVRVPTNYNPVTRVYADGGTPWDGTFKMAWTNNPVWILYELITNDRWGLTRYYKHATANRYEFYVEAKWCDEMVPDGRGTGGMQPRFTYNDWITEARDGMEMLRYVAGSFNAVLDDDGNGAIILRSDRPRASRHVFTPENVTPAGFGYTFSDPTTRYNDIQVAFVNPDLGWEQDWRPATIDNTAEIAKHGRVPFDFIAVGCTDSWEAVRRANYRYVTATKEIATVNFTTTRAGLMCGLLDTITVADPLADWGATGRIKTATASVIQLRDPIYFATLDTRAMKVQTYDGIVTIQVTPLVLGENYSLNVSDNAFPVANVPARTTFVIEDTADMGMSKPFRVLSIEEVEGRPDEVSISAVEIAADKYEQVEQTGGYVETKYSYTTPGEPMLPAALNLYSPDPQITSDGSLIYRIEATWTRLIGANRFDIDFKTDDDQSWRTVTSYGAQADLVPVKDGKTYSVRLYAVSPTGMRSQKCLEGTVLVESKNASLENVTGLTAVVANNGWEIRWNPPANIPDFAGVDIRLGIATDTNFFTLPKAYFKDVSPQPMPWRASGTTRIMARYVDTSGNFSAATAVFDLVISNPDTPTLNVERTLEGTFIRFPDPTTSQPLRAILVRSGGNTATWDTATDKGSGGGNQRSIFVIPDLVADTKIFVRAQDEAGNLSNAAVQNIPAAASTVQQLIDIATNGVTFNNLADDFLEEIELISADASVEGSVNQRLQTVTSNSTGGTYTGLLGFNMNGSLSGWEGYPSAFGTFTANASSATLMANAGGQGTIRRGLSATEKFAGSKADKIRARVKRVGTPTWYGLLYYGIEGGHSEDYGFRKMAPEPVWDATTGWGNVEWDMTALDAGGTDWLTHTINYLRIDLTTTGADTTTDGFEIDFISIGSNAGSDTYSLVQQESLARVDADGYLGAQWALRVALISGGSVAAVGGIGVSGTNSGAQGPRFDIAFRANTITFLPPSGVSDTQYAPFVYYTTTTVVNGVSIPAGLYLKSAFIDYITAAQIDTRQLTIKNSAGEIIFGSGTNLDWTRINAASGWLNSNQQWNEVTGRPKSYRVGAYGYGASGMPMGADLLDADTNALLLAGSGMYRVAKINRTTKVLTDLGAYAPLSGGLADCNAMAAALNSIDNAHVCVVYTYDEPAGNRLLGDLPAAMYRNGASRAVWGSSAFRYRSAYILIGIGGCGEGNGAEVYAGSVDNDPHAWCETTFQITAQGALIVSGAVSGAKSLQDFGYTGDLDATKGASWNSNITGQPSDDAIRNNLVDLSWWRRAASSPWPVNGEENILYATDDVGGFGPRGGSDVVWYCREAAGNSGQGGGWDANNTLTLDPTKTYRFVVPIKVRDTGLGGTAYWGAQPSTVCSLNSTTPDGNPYFAARARGDMSTDRWYLFVGYVFPYDSINNSHSGAGIYDCKTGALLQSGQNYNHSSGGCRGHRAYQYYAGLNATQLFGRPLVNVVDGTEPSLREYFETGAVLNEALVPAIRSAAGLKLIADGAMSVNGNIVEKTANGGDWNASVRSANSFVGGAYASWVVTGTAGSYGIGLNTDPTTNASYDSVDCWLYQESPGNLFVYNNGVGITPGGLGSVAVGDVLSVTFDGSTVRYMKNSTVLYSQPYPVGISPTTPIFLDSSFNTQGNFVSNIQFGPMTSNAWAAVSGPGRPQDNATVGATWNGNVSGQPSDSAITNTNISVSGGTLNGIGTGNGTTVSNSYIGMDSGGALYGMGAGNGIKVSNGQINVHINADGTPSVSGGPSSSGGVTPNGIGAIRTDLTNAPGGMLESIGGGAFARLNQITSVNVSTYMAAAAIDYSRIGVLQAGNLSIVALKDTINGGVTSGMVGRIDMDTKRIDVYDDNNVRRVRLGLL